MAAEEKKEENMVVLRSRDGVDIVVPERVASESMLIEEKINDGPATYIIPSDGDETKCKPIHLPVQRNTLSMVVRYCHKHADPAGSDDDDPDWDAEFVAEADHETLYDLILVSSFK